MMEYKISKKIITVFQKNVIGIGPKHENPLNNLYFGDTLKTC